MTISLILFWSSAVILVYTFFVFPCLIFLRSRFGRLVRKDNNHQPFISLLVPVYNEEEVIEEKLANCLALEYPRERLEIVFASDGSNDQTVPRLTACADPRVRVLAYPWNKGKAFVLNESIPQLKGELVLLTDASGMPPPDTLRSMASYFADKDVGAVGGIYGILKEGRTHMDTAESSYHSFEMMLRTWEGRIWTTLSGTGALCMIRRKEYELLPENVINEDYVIPARLALRGKRVIYDPGAHVYDRVSTSLRSTFRRRVRIAYGNWQMIGYLKGLLNPLRGYLFVVFLSHKLLRMAFPFLLVLLFATSYSCSPWLFASMSAGLGLLVLTSLLALVLDKYLGGHNPLGVVALVFLNTLAVFWGTVQFFAGRAVRW